MRWALKGKTVQAKFTEKQKAYMLEKYSLGQVTEEEYSFAASTEMRLSGEVKRDEFLIGQ